MTHERPLSYHQLDLFDAPISLPAAAPQVEDAHNSANAETPLQAEITSPVAPTPEPVQALPPPVETPPTFADAMTVLESATDLTPTQRRDQISALNVVADKILHAPLANIPGCPAYLNGVLFEHPPSAFKLGASYFGSVVSRLRAVLRRLGTHLPHELGEDVLSTSWQDFLGHIQVEARRGGLRRFARFCDRASIQPTSVNDAALADFLTFDWNGRLAAAHSEQGPNLASAWRASVREQPASECFNDLKAPRRREPYTFAISTYPAAFQESVEAFRNAVRRIERASGSQRGARITLSPPSAPLSGPFTATTARPFRRLKPSSVETRVFSIQQAAAAIVHQGVPMEEITSLASLVQPVERAHQAISFYLDRAEGKAGSQTEAVAVVLHQIAKHHARVPAHDLKQIADWRKEVSASRTGEMCAKARKCIHGLWQRRARAILLNLPEILEERSLEGDLSPIERARMMRAAVLIEILIRCPLRIGNLHSLRLDRHLVWLNETRRPSHILIEPDETKNDNPVSFPIPDDAARLIQRYLERSRPLLAEPGNPFLFPGEELGPLSNSQTRKVFKDYVTGSTGVDVYPHAMRHFAGRLFLAHHPGQYEILRRVLGHKDVETTKAFYTGLETDEAFALSDATLLKERAMGRKLARAALSKLLPVTPRPSRTKG